MVSAIGTPLGDRIRRLREDRGWIQKELAAAAGVPREWLSTVETGAVESPSAERLDLIAAALNVDTRYLLTGESGQERIAIAVDADAVGDVSEFASWPPVIRHLVLMTGRAARALLPIEHAPDEEPDQPSDKEPQGE